MIFSVLIIIQLASIKTLKSKNTVLNKYLPKTKYFVVIVLVKLAIKFGIGIFAFNILEQ